MFWIVELSEKFVFIQPTSYSEMGLWYAKHWYGTLKFRGKREELRRTINTEEARELNRDEGIKNADSGAYKAGMTTSRFFNKKDIIDFALKTYKNFFPKAVGLIEGDPCIAEVQKILDGPKDYMEVVNKLSNEREQLNWDYDEERLNEIMKEWETLTKQKVVGEEEK